MSVPAALPLKVQPSKVQLPPEVWIPPPDAVVVVTELPLKVVSVKVQVPPEVRIAPPSLFEMLPLKVESVKVQVPLLLLMALRFHRAPCCR